MCYSLKHDKNNHTSINKVVYLAKKKKKEQSDLYEYNFYLFMFLL